MSKSIKNLREELEISEQKVIILEEELAESYRKYFSFLADAVNKQLVLACYQICTQKYPDNFLKLSLSKRQNLQKKLKSLSFTFKQKLADSFSRINFYNQELIKELMNIILVNSEEIESKLNEETDIENEQKFLQTEENSLKDTQKNDLKLTPELLIQLNFDLSESIQETLKYISRKANRYLQQQEILSPEIPPKILDLALEAEENISLIANSPNLMSLLIEKEHQDTEEKQKLTPIVAICLRLGEIEFVEANLSYFHNQIRDILVKIEKLREVYDKQLRQYTMAEAEAAWRVSWFND